MSDIIIIRFSDYLGRREWYGTNFRCPDCGEENIFGDFQYCPMCGMKIQFAEDISALIDKRDAENEGWYT